MTTRLALAVLTASLTLTACGGSNDKPTGPFAAQDSKTLAAMGAPGQDLVDANKAFIAAVSDSDVPAATRSADKMATAADDLRGIVRGFESPALRKPAQTYVGTLQDSALTAVRMIAYYADDTTAADPVLENSLSSEYQKAALASGKAGDDFVEAVIGAVPADSKADARKLINDAMKKAEAGW